MNYCDTTLQIQIPLKCLILARNEPSPIFKVLEYGFDLMSNPLLEIQPRAKNMMPKPFINTDAVINKKSFSIQKEK